MNDWCFILRFCTIKAILDRRQPGRSLGYMSPCKANWSCAILNFFHSFQLVVFNGTVVNTFVHAIQIIFGIGTSRYKAAVTAQTFLYGAVAVQDDDRSAACIKILVDICGRQHIYNELLELRSVKCIFCMYPRVWQYCSS